jgi:hypothetical protein
VAVFEARPIELADMGPNVLREAVVDGIKAQGGLAIPTRVPPSQPPVCDTPDCFKAVAEATGASHVLRIDGVFGDDRYDLQMQIWNRRTGEVVTSERERCKLCLAEDMLRLARNQVAYVVGRAFAPEPSRGSAQRKPTELDSDSDSARLADYAPVPDRPTPALGTRARHRLGWALIGLGAASAVGAVVELTRDKNGSQCANVPGEGSSCPTRHRTWPAALGFGAGALAGAGVGTWLIFHSPRSGSEVSLSITPTSVGLGGVF